LIELRRVWYEREGRQILSDVSFEVDRGEFVYLTGTTGAGKTTALRLMLLEERPTRGAVFVGEYDSETIRERDLPRLRRRVGAVLQDLKLLRDRTVFENVAFALEVTGMGRRAAKRRSLSLLSSVELMHKRDEYPDSLSAGERQCVAIARALANDPFVLLADEPTANMDPESTDRVMGIFSAANARGTAVVVGTHDAALVARHPRRRLVLEGGRLQPAG
jgi:cell division transport system ATP-binding protein